MRAPDLPLQFLDGSGARLGDWLGRRPIYLKMWATWCSTCRAEMPHFTKLYDQYGRNVVFLSVNAGFNDTIAAVREFNDEYGLKMPTVIDADGAIGQELGLVATPYHVLIDAGGTIAYLGHKDDAQIDALLSTWSEQTRGREQMADIRGDGRPRASGSAIPQEGDPAPSFSLQTLSGAVFSMDNTVESDNPTYLYFFTTWCESYFEGEGNDPETARACRRTRHVIDAAFADSADPPRLIGIASRMWTGTEDLRQYRTTMDPPYPLALDETNTVFQHYGIRQFPALIVVSGGKVLKRLTGEVQALPEP